MSLKALLKAAEKSKGSNRKLDCLIFEWQNPQYTPDMRGSYYGEFTGEYFRDGDIVVCAPHYSSDLGIAVKLVQTVLPGWAILMAITSDKTVCDIHTKPLGDPSGQWPGHAEHQVSAIAVLIGLFKALVVTEISA